MTSAAASSLPRHGVLTLTGYGISVNVDRGHLKIEDGIADERTIYRLPRVGHGLRRLVVIGSDGFVSLAALRWLSDQKVSFQMLSRNGKPILVTGPTGPSDARLRRSQALSSTNGTAEVISKRLIDQKLRGQERVLRLKFDATDEAAAVAALRSDLRDVETAESIRLVEAQAASIYWNVWRNLPVTFPTQEIRLVPKHWLSFGTRVSQLTGSPRLACNPANAILNYLYALLESEARLAATAMGLDPGIGLLHVDTHSRDSLACDLMEPVRPMVDQFLIDSVLSRPVSKKWFFEERNGNCRLMAGFTVELSKTARSWARELGPIVECTARALFTRRKAASSIATRLTQTHRRLAKNIDTDVSSRPIILGIGKVCSGCGSQINNSSKQCQNCYRKVIEQSMSDVSRIGRLTAYSKTARKSRSEKRRNASVLQAAWDPQSQPAWLTEAAFKSRVLPKLGGIKCSIIGKTIGVTDVYAAGIRKGRYLPHPRHWKVLATLAGLDAKAL